MWTVRYARTRNAWGRANHRLRGLLNVFWCKERRWLCRLARCGSKGQYSVYAAGPASSARLARTGRASIWDADEDREE
jgi:hypothetical protein